MKFMWKASILQRFLGSKRMQHAYAIDNPAHNFRIQKEGAFLRALDTRKAVLCKRKFKL